MRRDWWIPLLGVLFVAISIAAFAVAGEPPGADEGGREIVQHYVDNKGSVIGGAVLAALAMTAFVYFAAYLRTVFSAAAGGTGMLPPLVLIGAAIMAVGVGIDATISFALAEQADEIDPVAAQALQALWDNDFMPMAIGLQIFFLAAGLATVIHGGLPKWLGWIAILLAIAATTPAGFVAFMGGAVWILIVSIMLTMRNRAVVA